MTLTIILALAAVLAAAFAYMTAVRLRTTKQALDATAAERDGLLSRYKPIVDVEAERDRVLADLATSRAAIESEIAERVQQSAAHMDEIASLQSRITKLTEEFTALDEEANLQSFGLYEPHYAFDSAERYAEELERIREAQKAMIKDETAATCGVAWTVNGSEKEGRKQIKQTLKLMLRAFNGETDAAIAKVRYNNINVMETRIRKAHEVINSLAQTQSCTIATEYLQLRLKELYLAHEYQEQLQAEKEEQRRIREQMREEEQALREIEKAKADAEKEEKRYEDALEKARRELESTEGKKHDALAAQIEELTRKLAEAHLNKERAISRAQMTKSGHVYVISNIGAFGEKVFKIGMTRRLEPLDRVKELGDSSVPFDFDVHALIFSEDAPSLENALHRKFHHRRVNRVNEKREFFNVSVEEIADVVRAEHNSEVEFTMVAEAAEYRKTLAILAQEGVEEAMGVASVHADPVSEAMAV